MKKAITHIFIALSILFFYSSCTVNNVTVDDSIAAYFKKKGLTGTFGMFDNSRGEFTIYDLDRFKTNFPAGQSMMLFSKLVAVHTGKLASDTIQIGFDSLNQLIGKDT
ncbi:MAG: hypothetical protein ACO22R_09585, partial [Chitinophagaceae bacterium]